jgi:predicted TIM-barrel fold metal-dependent hydrolase
MTAAADALAANQPEFERGAARRAVQLQETQPEFERGAAMRAVQLEETRRAAFVAKREKIFAHDPAAAAGSVRSSEKHVGCQNRRKYSPPGVFGPTWVRPASSAGVSGADNRPSASLKTPPGSRAFGYLETRTDTVRRGLIVTDADECHREIRTAPKKRRAAIVARPTRRRIIAGAAGVSALLLTEMRAGLAPRAQTRVPIIDAHTHIARNLGEDRAGGRGRHGGFAGGDSLDTAVSRALEIMDRFGVATAILSPPPFPVDRSGTYGVAELQAVVRAQPDRFAFSAGGESLNPLIQGIAPEQVTPELLARFTAKAQAIAAAGAAAFGELAAEHFSAAARDPDRPNHPYESARPDHPFLLALVDIAAGYGMPVELHMEAVPHDMAFPNAELAGPPNPAYLRENMVAFGRLLDHNPRARVVWVHAGWDLTGERTVPLMLSLLGAHTNLFMSIKSDPAGTPATAPFRPGGGLKPNWLAMVQAFPDRFVIGSDQFYDSPPVRSVRARKFVDLLPADLAPLVAYANVRRIYRLQAAAH